MTTPQGEFVWPLKVTAGIGYDPQCHHEVDVNGQALALDGNGASVNVAVRIRDYDSKPMTPPNCPARLY